ncbi:MAG: hypothetical protein H8E12_06240 [Rhodobacteraceae bacterium]|nr:hypothetical protein [Paracoccaceae bacterium]
MMEITKTQFGPGYALASNGQIKYWKADVYLTQVGAVTAYQFGYENGKLQTQETLITEGKNIGRSNETTPFQQACKEAESKYRKKCEEGYQEDPTTLTIPTLPMLAHGYNKRKHDIQWPCYIQPKVDGVRCLVGYHNDTVTLTTRKGKKFTALPHITKDLARIFKKAALAGHQSSTMYLDGEMYSDSLTFQELAGAVRRQDNTQQTLDQIYLVVFDVFWTDLNTPYENRRLILDELFKSFIEHNIKQIDTRLIGESELEQKHLEYIQAGYEGIMLRNRNGVYKVNQRSADLQKLKVFADEEFEIFGAKEGEGVEKGCVVWQCLTNETNQLFWVRPRGTHNERKELFKNSAKYLGQKLTVRYQELTDDGIPRFPVGVGIRDYE